MASETISSNDHPLQQALDAAGEVIFMTDRDGVFTFVNREFERVYGYSAPEVVGRCTPRILKSGQTSPESYEDWWARLVRGETIHQAFVNRTKDGRVIEVDVSANAVRGDLREVVGFIAVQRDVTARNKADAALKQSEGRYRTLAETAADEIFIVDRENRYEYLNSSAARVLGGEKSPVGRQIAECFPPRVGAELEGLLDQARQSPVPIYLERRIQFPTGVRWKGTWLHEISEAGASGHVMGIARDITTQRELAEQLERQNLLLNAMIAASPIGILLLNSDRWTCDIANPAVQKLATRDLTAGTQLADGWPEVVAELMPVLKDALRGDGSIQARIELAGERSRAGGTGNPRFAVNASRVQLPQRAPCVLVMLTDVTERLQLEEQLLQAQKMEAIGRLAGGIAHDFNNMLTPILGYADLLGETLADGDKRRSDVDEIGRAAKSAAALTRQLLTFSRKQVTDPVVLDLNEVLADVHKILRRSIGEDVELVQRHEASLGSIRADRNQLEQVVMNLSVNARDAMPHGGVLTIATTNRTLTRSEAGARRTIPPGDYVVLSVADTGAGMTRQVLSHLFEPFFTTKDFGKGTGLGLSTVYGIVRESGGYITVASAPGEGTTFTIYFPRVDTAAAIGTDQRQAAVKAPHGVETVLIVEDNDGVKHLAERVLTKLGYVTLTASNAEEALRISTAYDKPIHLLISDIVMPGADGILLARRLGVRRPETRVLFVSGYSGSELAARDAQMKGMKLLHKPFTPTTLGRAVRDVLDAEVLAPAISA